MESRLRSSSMTGQMEGGTFRDEVKADRPDPQYENLEEREVITGEEADVSRARSEGNNPEPGWPVRTKHTGKHVPGKFDWEGKNAGGTIPGL